MYIKIKNKKLDIIELATFKEKYKSLKFYFKKLDHGLKLSNKKIASTYFFVQRVDICFTNKDNRIVRLVEYAKSEKMFFCKDAYNIYYLPIDTVKNLKLGDILKEK